MPGQQSTTIAFGHAVERFPSEVYGFPEPVARP